MPTPTWLTDAIFYQIFPDRFANGDPSIDPPNVQPWGAPPTRKRYQGGDLKGITQKLDYLLDLGINAIYLNPIFLSPANHRYHTTDYFRIDPWLGSLDDFHTLVDTAHRSGIRIILDGVFNHCSRGFYAFNDILENQTDSPYTDWFHVHRFPLRAYEPGKARNYAAWWGFKDLPKFNTDTPAVRRYLLDVARYWIEQGADGWRLDVPNEIDDDSFWAEFRQVVRRANPAAYLVGEIWQALPRWVDENHFDGLMNYPLRTAILEFLNGKITTGQFAGQVEPLLSLYSREHVYAMYNLLGSHDTERVLTYYGGDVRKVRLAYLFLFAYPGVPSIYYGDEVGLAGGKDPDCRRAFPWDAAGTASRALAPLDAAQWDAGLHDWVKSLISLRKASSALKDGDYIPLFASDFPRVYAFARTLGEERVLVAMNAEDGAVKLRLPVHDLGLADGSAMQSLLGPRQEVVVEGGHVEIAMEAYSGVWMK